MNRIYIYTYQVEDEMPLFLFLIDKLQKERSRSNIKQLLTKRFISVNGVAQTKWDYLLKKNDVVNIHKLPVPKAFKNPWVTIHWENEDFVIVEKKAGISTINNGTSRQNVLRILSDYYKEFDKSAKVFLLTRLEKDASGILFFAKNREAQQYAIESWKNVVVDQEFLVVCKGFFEQNEGELEAPKPDENPHLKNKKKENIHHMVGRASYRVMKTSPNYTLFKAKLQSGRNNLLRRQMKELQKPIVGDQSAGAKMPLKKMNGIALCAYKLTLKLPKEKEKIRIQLATPSNFLTLLKIDR